MDRALVFRAARVWDGVADAPFEDGFVAVEGETITALGRWAEVGEAGGPLPGVPVTDCGNATLLPGLINSHVHLTLSGSTTVLEDYLAEQSAGPEVLMSRAVENLRAAARGGVTSVRDCGTVNEVAFAVREAVAAGRLIGPRVVTSGAPLTSPGGHCHFFSLQVASSDELRRAVTSQARAGADLIKVFVTGGNLTPNTDPFALQYSAERLTVAVNAAHEHGLRVAAHAHAPAGIRVAVEAGVDTIEHCLFETPGGVAYDEAVVDRIAAQGIVVSPTVGNPPAATADEAEALIVADPAWQRLFERLSEFRRNFRRMFDAGVVLAGGSDAGIARRTFDHYPLDVAAMADGAPAPVGLSRLDALRAATSVAAEVCGLGATGRLASGHRADLLAVGGNPLARIGDLRDVRLVVCGGRLVIGRSDAA